MTPAESTICVYDRGLFISWAELFAKTFKRVLLYSDWKEAFPVSKKFHVGDGLDNVEHIPNFWDRIDDIDIFFFPDIIDGDLQAYLRSQGKLVWGSGKGEELEMMRYEAKQLFKKVGLPVSKFERIIGMPALREYLKKNDDLYVKLSGLRGDAETFQHIRYELSEPRLDEIEYRIGPRKGDKEFIVEEAVEPAMELGYDGWTILGGFPERSLIGLEKKNVGYVGCVRPNEDIPEQLTLVNDKLSPIFKKYDYRGYWSSEVRIKDDVGYLVDPTCRCPSPPGGLMQEIYSNWPDIIAGGAQGEIVQPKAIAKYGVIAMIGSEWAARNWQPIHFPAEIKQWVKLANYCVIDKTHYVIPQDALLTEIGQLVGLGSTLLEAIGKVKEYSGQIEGYDVSVNLEAIPDAVEEIREGEEHGVMFSDDELPSAEEVEEAIRD